MPIAMEEASQTGEDVLEVPLPGGLRVRAMVFVCFGGRG